MKLKAIKIYTHIVCFLTLILATVYFGTGVYEILNIVVPDYMVSDQVLEEHKDNTSFIASHYKSNLHEYLTDEQIKQQRLTSLNEVISERRKKGITDLFISLTVIISCAVLFVWHRRINIQTSKGALST